MNLFEFLMILLSLIVGLGMAEILSGMARFLKKDGPREIPWIHGAATMAVFVGLLQTFWESWGLRTVETWSFPAMLLMLGSPICLYLMAYILFPEQDERTAQDRQRSAYERNLRGIFSWGFARRALTGAPFFVTYLDFKPRLSPAA